MCALEEIGLSYKLIISINLCVYIDITSFIVQGNSNQVPLTINVINENDNIPKFNLPSYVSYIMEGETELDPPLTVQVLQLFPHIILGSQKFPCSYYSKVNTGHAT